MISMHGALVLIFVASTLAQKDVEIDCKADEVTVKWRPVLNWAQKVEASKAHLGSCSPSSLDEDVLVFFVHLGDCGFKTQVNDGKVTFAMELTYGVDPEVHESVECIYDLSVKKTDSNLKNDLVFSMELMNNDFSGPAPSTMFTLGSRIAIKAEVQHLSFEPLHLYLQRCVLATAPDLARARQLHTVISNSGCLVESKEGNAAFLPREKPSEISFYFEAFKFALGQSVFFLCDMVAKDHQVFSVDEKACHFLKGQRRWDLLDDPSQNYICGCCDTACIQRSRWSGASAQKVLGPFIIEDAPNNSSDATLTTEGLGGFPAWLVGVTILLVLLLVVGAIATGYYLCFWRGGRLGYRPSRDLLTKY